MEKFALLIAFGIAAAACGRNEPAPVAATPPPNAKRVDLATAGTIGGRILFEGAPPENPIVKLDSDPACVREHPNGMTVDAVLVANGGLQNVFVYVKDGLGGYYFDTPPEAMKVDQKGCRYTPHVFGVRVGQPIEISNSDATMHNVHAIAKTNREFDLSQPLQGIKHTKTFTAPEVMVQLKCNVHNWMTTYVGVVPHPYFAVSADGGGFELKNLPPGTYTVEAWHEKFGTQTQSVTLADKQSKTLNFTFKAS